jgi:Uma2 family endonuclease
MALVLGDRELRPLTADEVIRMVEVGLLSEDEPVELLHGVLTAVGVKTHDHSTAIMRLARWLIRHDPEDRYDVFVEAAVRVPDRTSLPEPDIAVVEAGQPPKEHPTTALLVIEVAVSSLRIDTTIKPPLYAAAGVPELWVVDVPRHRLEVFTAPSADGYGDRTTLAPPQRATPRHVEAPPLDLAELFAGL